ncbi:MAG: OprO/OprP family phosphate-selective porin [Pseudobdellovibrionaceae bacterium]
MSLRSAHSILSVLTCAFLLMMGAQAFPQENENVANSTQELDASEADGTQLRGEGSKWNEFENDYFTTRIGSGLLLDTAAYDQDDNSREQMDLEATTKLRDLRILLKGKIKGSPRLSYTLGYMYDGANEVWRFRQTGLMIQVPEYDGNIFIGRTKETFSTSKIMVGYFGWTNERSAANDALLPILADGIKWTGGGFGGKFVYSFGAFTNAFARHIESFVKNDSQLTARGVWLPFVGTGSQSVLHLSVAGRSGTAYDDKLQYRSKPESFAAQSYAIDTGKFPATASNMLGLEAYYRPGPLMFGSEYYFNQVSSQEAGDPLFQGGEVFAAYLLTGEIRPYNEKGAFFESVKPSRDALHGGPGAWEFVLRYSYADMNSGNIEGGRFRRITPMVNWHISDNVRLELAYGYSVLDRFGLEGHTQYLQTRIQLQM